ncbi:MAG TPA: class I SAM-dependent methyltransferase [Terriglobales bacterium]|jgi:SAM-dependent methyltransferase|nr:class I SAM-dependent methyltransferase [Terriglobales bacterium]
MDLMRNAWEGTEEQALDQLAGHSTREEFEADRRGRAKEVLKWCSVRPKSRGFEIGSGEGTVARLLAGHCLSLDCNDISASFLARARANCAQCANVSFHQIQSNYLDYLPAEAYDFGFSLNVFIHFNPYDVYNYLLSVNRILKPGGVFYFDACTVGEQTLPLFREQAAMYRNAPETIRGLLNYNSPHMLRTVVAEAGLKLSDRSLLSEQGWMKVLTIKRGGGWLTRRGVKERP